MYDVRAQTQLIEATSSEGITPRFIRSSAVVFDEIPGVAKASVQILIVATRLLLSRLFTSAD
jgi:hypothetical protein